LELGLDSERDRIEVRGGDGNDEFPRLVESSRRFAAI
jgi:hypothetical protein